MPEGDTIHRVADRLRPALAGQPLVRLELARVPSGARRPAPGTEVSDVEAVGKHLLVRFADGAVLRTHLRMTGSWHLYRRGERWRRPAHLARAVIEVPEWVAVCFAAPVVVLEHERSGGGRPGLALLGPDLTSDALTDADIDACLDRLAALTDPADEIGPVLLDQRIACGVGNVYKSEVLWACRVHPSTPVGAIDGATRRQLLTTAARLLRANAAGSGRRVTFGGGVAVYGRRGRACPRCGTAILAQRQGEHARMTFWCPTCQPVEESATA